MSSTPNDPSVTQQVMLDAICVRFEQAQRQGQQPTIESYLNGIVVTERNHLLPQLLLLELEYLQQNQLPPQIDAYLARFPNDATLVRRAFDVHVAALGRGLSEAAQAQRGDVQADGVNPVGTVDHAPIAERPGSQIGPYKLLEQIGEGGMGVVYMAEQLRPVRRKVALKIIKPGMDTKQVIARFEAERQALAMMDHPNIARVLDAGSTESKRPYFVMELVRGIPITHYCDQNKLATSARLELFVSVCQAVQHAHQKGIIHRDIKPTNVLVTLHDGVPIPKIIDFGVAKATNQQLTERTLFTAFAQMVGTPLYMSPEQAEMSGLDVDTRSDIYSLGVLLYELLTGSTPFDRKRLSTAAYDEIRRIIREEEPAKPSTRISSLGETSSTICAQRNTDAAHLRQSLRGELDWIVMKALEKDRTRRYQTARGLAADVNRHLAGEAVEACPPTLRYRLSKFVRRNKAPAAVAAMFLTLLVASSVVAWILFANARRARNDAVVARAKAEEAQNNALAAKEEIQTQKDLATENFQLAEQRGQELKRRLYDYNLINAAAAYRENDRARTSRLLADCLPEQRGWEWSRLNRLAAAERTLHLTETPYTGFTVSPVEPRILVLENDGTIRLFDIETGREIMSQSTGIPSPAFVSFDPSGRLAAIVQGGSGPEPPKEGKVAVWNLVTKKMVWEVSNLDEVFTLPAFSPDSTRLAIGSLVPSSGKSFIHLIDLRTKELIWKEPTRNRGGPFVEFAPDGEHLFFTVMMYMGRSTLHYWSLEGPTENWSASRDAVAIARLTPDGAHVVAGDANHALQLWDARSGKRLQTVPGASRHPDAAVYSVFSPGGRHFVSIGHLGHFVVRDWATKRVLQSGAVAEESMVGLGFTPSGEQLVVASPTRRSVEFRDVHPAPSELLLSGHEQVVKRVAFTADGRHVLSTSMDGTLRRWSTATGQELQTQVVHPTAPALALSPAGDYVATGGRDGAKLWKVDTGELAHHWSAAGEVWWIDFSPDGERIVAGGAGKRLTLWDTTTRKQLLSREMPERIEGLVISADGRHAISLMEFTGQLDVWDLESGDAEQLRAATEKAFARSIVMSPQGNIVAAGIDHAIEVWDVDRKRQLTKLQGHDAPVLCLAFNRDGSRLFSGDVGGTVKAWNLDTGAQLLSMPAHASTEISQNGMSGVQSLALSPDGKTLASAGADGLVKLWETVQPTIAIAEKRRTVQQAAQVVGEKYQRSGSQRDVLESLLKDDSISKDLLATAVEIANARGDRPPAQQVAAEVESIDRQYLDVVQQLSAARRSLVDLVENLAGVDFDQEDVNAVQSIDASDWHSYATSFVNPTYLNLVDLDLLIEPLIDSYPQAHHFVFLRGLAHARRNRWREAEVDLSMALARVPEKSDLWHEIAYRLAFLHVHLGNIDRYHALCEQALADYGDTQNSQLAERIAKMCLFSNFMGVAVEQAAKLADRSAQGLPTNIYRWYAQSMGIAELRRGNWQLAIEILRQTQDESDNQFRDAASLLYQAVAYEKLAQHEKAREMLAVAQRVMQSPGFPQPGDDIGSASWNDWLNVRIVQDEVQELFKRNGQDPDDASSDASAAVLARAARQIVSPGSDFKWLHSVDGVDPAAEGGDFHSNFFNSAYDDSHWQTGRDGPGAEGGFGYGDPAGVAWEAPVDGVSNTAYFRHRFTTEQAYDQLTISLQRDDGFIVYLDGVEVGRNNVGDEAEAFGLHAQRTVDGDQETWVGFYKLTGGLEPGEHVLAISLHNSPNGSSDLRLAEVALWGRPRNAAAGNGE